MPFYTIKALAKLYRSKKASCTEITQDYLQTIKQYNPILNAFITIADDSALEQAKKADASFNTGQTSLLMGIPIAHKDIFCTKGIKTSCGSKMLDNFIAPYDAHVVTQLNQAGTIMLGKLNMDEFAMGSSNETSFYGAVKNPWQLDRTPGGSSGGSASAVAAGLCLGATGTDTGGSIRQPAALCGITGLKPTYGRVSRYGMIAYASSLDQAGPMARSAEDCAFLLNAMAGFDERDSTVSSLPTEDYTENLNAPLQGLRIGVPEEFFVADLQTEVIEAIEAALKVYEQLGAKIKKISLPHNALSLSAYYVIAPAEASSNLARYDGVRYGHRCSDPKSLEDLYSRSRQEGFGPEVQRRILVGTYVLSSGYYDAYYLKAQQLRRLISQDFNDAFTEVDVIMGPTSPHTAFTLGEKVHDPLTMYLSDIYTLAANLAGIPGISLPAGFVNGLPVGLQILGPLFSEAKLLNVAHQFQQATDYHQHQPKLGELS